MVSSLRSPGSSPLASSLPVLLISGLLFVCFSWACAPDDPLAEMRRLQQQGRARETMEPLRRMVEAGESSPQLDVLYGRALIADGTPNLAAWPLRRAMEDPDYFVPAGLLLSRGVLMAWDQDEAIKTLTAILEVEPDNIPALTIRAKAYEATRRNYDLAIADADRVLELDPDNFEVLIPRTTSLLLLERTEEAQAALAELERRSAELEGESASSHYCRVNALFLKEQATFERDQRKIDAAEAQFEKCLANWPTDHGVLQEATEFYRDIERPERILEILETAHEADPKDRVNRLRFSLHLERLGRAAEAEALLLAATEFGDERETSRAWLDMAVFYTNQQRRREAAEAYETAFSAMENPIPELVFAYGDLLVMTERYDEALEVAAKSTVPAHRALLEGRVHLQQGDNVEALESFSDGIASWPDNPVARYYAAVAAERLGDFTRAIEEYRYSARAGAGATNARYRLAKLYFAQGDDEFALAVLQHALHTDPPDLPMALLELEIRAKLGLIKEKPPQRLIDLVGQHGAWAEATAAIGAGIHAKKGPEAALKRILETDKVDLTAEGNEPVLRAAGLFMLESGQEEELQVLVARALGQNSNSPALYAVGGELLERSGASPDRVEAAYARALQLNPNQPRALIGMAGVAARADDPSRALELLERGLALGDYAEELTLEAVEIELLLGRQAQAEKRLAELLNQEPFYGIAALRLAELLESRGAPPSDTRQWAERALRFGGGPNAARLVEELEKTKTTASASS